MIKTLEEATVKEKNFEDARVFPIRRVESKDKDYSLQSEMGEYTCDAACKNCHCAGYKG